MAVSAKQKPFKIGLKLKLVFSEEERDALMDFQSLLNEHGTPLSIEQVCRQAIFYSISDSRRRAEAAYNKAGSEQQHGKSENRNVTGDSSSASGSEAPGAGVVAETQASGDTTPAST